MNYPALLLYGIILLLFFAVLFFPFAQGYDYIETYMLDGGFIETPVVCLIDPPDKFLALKGAKAWEIELRKHTNSNEYDYRIRVVENPDSQCNIRVLFGNPVELMKGKSELGVALCYNFKEYRYCKLAVNWDFPSDEDVARTTLIHELGHALGLGHRTIIDHDKLSGVAQIVLEDEIMFKQASPWDKITTQDLDALLFFYNNTGWNKGITNQNYTIPH